ncbi:MAG: hypothetical protein HOW97_26415 [Catenulispora sp.]|nr:hypothetical protein [Catenulispora sp.]
MTRTALEKIADREQAIADIAEHLSAQISQLTARLAELDAECGDLALVRKVILSLGDDEPGGGMPTLPDDPIYQHILTALTDAAAGQRCRDLCRTLATGTEPTHISNMRTKLKRLTSAGLVIETEHGLFANSRTSNRQLTTRPAHTPPQRRTGHDLTQRPVTFCGDNASLANWRCCRVRQGPQLCTPEPCEAGRSVMATFKRPLTPLG